MSLRRDRFGEDLCDDLVTADLWAGTLTCTAPDDARNGAQGADGPWRGRALQPTRSSWPRRAGKESQSQVTEAVTRFEESLDADHVEVRKQEQLRHGPTFRAMKSGYGGVPWDFMYLVMELNGTLDGATSLSYIAFLDTVVQERLRRIRIQTGEAQVRSAGAKQEAREAQERSSGAKQEAREAQERSSGEELRRGAQERLRRGAQERLRRGAQEPQTREAQERSSGAKPEAQERSSGEAQERSSRIQERIRRSSGADQERIRRGSGAPPDLER